MPSAIVASDTADESLVEEVLQHSGPFVELGVTGLQRSAGYIDEEFLPQLKGKKAIQVYREMSDNDPMVGAMLFAVDKLIRNTDWTVVPAGKSRDQANAAKLVETAMEDMSHSWDDMVSEILSCVIYGWSWHEIVYKRRNGPWQKDGRQKSNFTDGMIGWRKMPIRAQETLQRWAFDETGSVRGMIQLGPPDYTMRTLPIERSLLFRYSHSKGSPEGRSMLRNAYRPWFYKKRIEEHEGIGVERDLAGLPMVSVPAEWLKARKGTEQAAQVDAFKKMIRGVRRNEQEGIVFPTAYDQETKQPLFKMELLGSGGERQFQTNEIIQRYEQRILMTILADFIMVGHQRVGTYNLHLDKTGIFRTALNATASMIADVFNRYAIPRLFAVNGWKPADLPKIQPSDVDAPDIAQLVQFMTGTAQLGFTWGPDADMERYLRRAAGLPELREDDYNKRRKEARMEEATRFAEEQTRYLAARSTLAQTIAGTQMQAEGEQSAEDQGEAMDLNARQREAETGQAEEKRTQQTHRAGQTTTRLAQAQQRKELKAPLPRPAGGSKGQSKARKTTKSPSKTGSKR